MFKQCGLYSHQKKNRLPGARAIILWYVYMKTPSISACRGPARSKFSYLRPRKKKSSVALSGETCISDGGDARSQTEVEAQQLEYINGQQKFFQDAMSNVASDGPREDDDITDFVTATIATIVADALAELSFLADGASIEEESNLLMM